MSCCWLFEAADAQPRYVKFGVGTPAAVLCSVTATRPVAAPGGTYPPHLLLNEETPASSSSRLVTGDVHVPCVIFSRSGHMLADSGEVVGVPRPIQSSPRSRHALPLL